MIEEATATELAELAVEATRAYADVFAERFGAGEDATVIVADVCADPTAGFGPAHASVNAVSSRPQSGPTLLFQAVFSYVDGQPTAARCTDVPPIRPIEMLHSRITMFLTAPTTRDRYRACRTARSRWRQDPRRRQPPNSVAPTPISRRAIVAKRPLTDPPSDDPPEEARPRAMRGLREARDRQKTWQTTRVVVRGRPCGDRP